MKGIVCIATALGLGCAGAACTTAAEDRVLELELAAGDRPLVATMSVDGERIDIESTTRDGLRVIRVTGEDGTRHLEWRMQLADANTEGSYGDRPFGRVEDADSDGDAVAWAAVLDSRTGEVLAAVSAGAERALSDPALAAAAADLTALSRVHPSLTLLAGRAPAAVPLAASCGTSASNTLLDAWAYYDAEIGTCVYGKDAVTFRPAGCTRGYYVQLYRIEGAFPGTYLCGDGTGDGPTEFAECLHVGHGRGYYAWRSKHWDQLNPGYPFWRNTARSC